MIKFEVGIKGVAPILQARHPSPIEEKKMLERKSGPRAKTKDLTDKEAFDIHAYRDSKKRFVQPAEMVEAAMVKAAVNFKMEGKKTFKDIIKSGIFITPINLVHKNQKFEEYALWGRNAHTGGAVWVVRPRCDAWELEFEINLLQDERISPEVLKDILIYAGSYVGIGAWRPKFGRFEVTKFKEVK
jgi:hypothetical protein